MKLSLYHKITLLLFIAALLLCSGCKLLNRSPIINSLTAEKEIKTSSETQIVCKASDPDGDNMTYQWSTDGGSITGEGSAITWTAPASSDNYTIQVTVSDGRGGVVAQLIAIAVVVDMSKHPSVAPYQRPPHDEFMVITVPLILGGPPAVEQQPGLYNISATYIPYGSVVYHWSNGITEVFGPDKKRIFIAKDPEATKVPTPGGSLIPMTRGLQVPSGCVFKGPPERYEVYLGGVLILTVVNSSASY